MAKTRSHVYVSGRVQGVYFRQHVKKQALIQGVTGWVRNLDDGRMEAVFEGEGSAVLAMVNYVRHGPKGSQITNFSVEWETFKDEYQSFKVVYREASGLN